MMTHTVDARRLLCPMPVIRLQDKVKQLNPGETVEVICTDPGTMSDIPAWSRINGHIVESKEEIDGEFHFKVVVGSDD